jgi:glycosyltransferase involved in cell wall biosynthesis
MPAYNAEKFLSDSVASVMAQTFKDWELLIVDDMSTDATLSLAQLMERRDARVRLIHLAVNGGVSNARNVGIEAALGQYLAFLDSDDLWLPEKLAIQLQFMKRHNAGFSFTSYRRLAKDGRLGGLVKVPNKVSYRQLLRGNVIGCLTVMIDRQMISPFSMPNVGHEDYATWLQILKMGNTAWGIQEDLARYRVSWTSVSRDKMHSSLWTWNIYRHEQKLSITKSLWYFIRQSIRAAYNSIAK